MTTYTQVPDLLYKGVAVYTLDTASGPSDPPIVPIPPTPVPTNTTVLATTVVIDSDDNFFLGKMIQPYIQALKSKPGAHQVFYDMLTDRVGRTYSDMVPQPKGTVKDPALKTLISQLINAASYDTPSWWDVTKYTGRLLQVYNNLVAAKLAQ